MADKRTTPEAPQEASQETPDAPRRKKRMAPTIDLAATEMQSSQADPPLPPPTQDPPQTQDEPSPPAGGWIGTHISAATLAAGVAGAACVTLVLFALWLTGLVPIRYAGSTAMRARVAVLEMQLQDLQKRPEAGDSKSADALSQRVSKIEETIAKLPAGDAGVAERLTAADNALKSLGIALTALNRHSDDTAANAAQARERADAAAKAVTELRVSLQEVTKNTSAGILPSDLDALQRRVAALEQSTKAARDEIAKASTSDAAARVALNAAALRDAVVSGAPFTAELAQAKSLGADEKLLAPLASFAATGVPAPAALAQELRVLIPAMLKVSGAQTAEGGFIERLQANAGKLVRIRPVDAPPGDDASAALARIEIDAAKADIVVALADLGKLTDAAQAPAQAWIAKAQSCQAALAAARQFAAETARALGSR